MIGRIEHKVRDWLLRGLWWALSAPVRLLWRLPRYLRRGAGIWILATRDGVACPGCGEWISLLGRWRCSWCDYVFDGFYFNRCEICGAVPPYVECQHCEHGVRNPML